MSELEYKAQNVWKILSSEEKTSVFNFSEGYKAFLDAAKTEREAVDTIKLALDNAGFVDMSKIINKEVKVEPGVKFYNINRGKSLVAGVLGKRDITEGCTAIGAHHESPRLDLMPTPLYEDSELAYTKTHYYGGIKKYQWLSIPLAMHGVVILNNGEKVEIKIGESDEDPVFIINDLLPHMSQEQYKKSVDTFVPAEQLNVMIGSIPFVSEESDQCTVKIHVLDILNKIYGIKERDFSRAEIEIVPAMKARDVGVDRGLIAAYGHDDRVCAYPAMMALIDLEDIPEYTAIGYFSDKEEIGSVGVTGARGNYLMSVMMELCSAYGYNDSLLAAIRATNASYFLSADVTAGFDPNFSEVYDRQNSAYLNRGIAIEKYTGARGKSGASDASAEYVSEIIDLLERDNVSWQLTEMGKVDLGGGGTIAQYMTDIGFNTIDCGVPVLAMHSPYEVISKADIYMTYKAYKAVITR